MRYKFAVAAIVTLISGCAYDAGTMNLRDIDRSTSPNDGLACPPGICRANSDFESPAFPFGRNKLTDIALAVFKDQPRTELVGRDPALDQLVFVQRSRLFGFPDTIWVQGETIDAQVSIIIYSRSNYGYWDLGVNRQRVQNWLAILEQATKHDQTQNPP